MNRAQRHKRIRFSPNNLSNRAVIAQVVIPAYGRALYCEGTG